MPVLKKKISPYVGALVILAGACFLSFSTVLQFLRQREIDGDIINKSGRQRMLTQRISYLSLRGLSEPVPQLRASISAELTAALGLLESSHEDLLKQAKESGLERIYLTGTPTLDQQTRDFIRIHRERPSGPWFTDEGLKGFADHLNEAVKDWEKENQKYVRYLVIIQSVSFTLSILLVLVVGFLIYRQGLQEEMIERQRIGLLSSSRLSALGEMASGIAHEINNPLAIINLNALHLQKLLPKESVSSPGAQEHLSDIMQTVGRISKIIQGLRTISRETSDSKKEELPLRTIFEGVLILCSERFKQHQVALSYNLQDPVFDRKILCDRAQMSQVLLNLLNNAFDAVDGLTEKRVEIGASENQHEVIIRVIDSGPGVPDNIRQKIFQPFFTTKAIGKGTGLGLSLSHAIITGHGGDLGLDPSSPQTCFVMTLKKSVPA